MTMRASFNRRPTFWAVAFVLVAAATLLVCLIYSYAAAFVAPYPGVIFDPSWMVIDIPECEVRPEWCQSDKNKLHVGDYLLRIGSLTYAQSRADRRTVAFEGYEAGALVNVSVQRGAQVLDVDWQMLGPTNATLLERLSGLLVFAPFWLAGTGILLYLRPRDARWRQLCAFNYVTALWLAVGLYSYLHVAYSSLLLHALSWLLLPVYLQLHLNIPSQIAPRAQRYLAPLLYLAAAVPAGLELGQLLPEQAYYVPLIVAIFGSLVLLAGSLLARRAPADRIAPRLIFVGIFVSFLPGIVLAVVPTLLRVSVYATLAPNVAILAVPMLPFFYVYAIYKHRLGQLEPRANRLLSLYSFVLIFITAFVVVHAAGSLWFALPSQAFIFDVVVSTISVVIALPLWRQLQRLFDRLAYGVKPDASEILSDFANRIPTALEPAALVELLAHELAPALLVRESALYLLNESTVHLFYAEGIKAGDGLEAASAVRLLAAQAGRYRPREAAAATVPRPSSFGVAAESGCLPPSGPKGIVAGATVRDAGDVVANGYGWVRLAIALKVRETTSAAWLLGRRDPDDFYSQRDITLLQTLGSIISTALENIHLFEETRAAAREVEAMRQQLHDALQVAVLEKSRYAAVIRSMSAATVMTGQDHRIAAVNPMAEALLRQSQADLIGRPWNRIFTAGDKGLTTPPFWHLSPAHADGERGLQIRGRFPLRTHPEVVLDVLSTEYQSEGRPEGYVHILQDVSALEEFARSKDQYLLNVAHELQGPLASWRASLDLLIEDYTTVSPRDLGVMLRNLQRNAIKFQGLVETLVDIGSMQAGRFNVRPRMVRFNQVILDSLSQIEPLLQIKGQQLVLNIDCVPACTVLADRQRIIQVIVNLLKNASKYAPEDQSIKLSAYQDGGFVFIEVTDSGPGISSEDQAQLFTRFYRAKRVEEEGAGIGIGLALVKGIVEAQGGQVGVRSRLGEGATFWFNLPEAQRPVS